MLAATAGVGLGLLCGLIVGELLGEVDRERMKRALRRLRPPPPDREEAPGSLRDEILARLARRPELRDLGIGVRALGSGLVELTGLAPDEATRTLAATTVQTVPGADIVVNRILVEGVDTREQPTATIFRAP